MQELLALDDDTTLLWVGYHPVWMLWGDERLRLDLRRYYFTGDNLSLEKYRIAGHVARVSEARSPEDALEAIALAHMDDDARVTAAVESAVDRTFGRRMLFRFQRANTPGRRWARWMIRRRRMSPGGHAERLDAACQKLLLFGAVPITSEEAAPLQRARIEAAYRAALYRPEYAPTVTEILTQYAVGAGGLFPPRRLALERLALLPERVCRERTLELLRHEDAGVRENAAYAVPRTKPVSARASLIEELFTLLEDPVVPVAVQAMNTLIDLVAGGSRMARFRAFCLDVAANPEHRLHSELRDAVDWVSGNTRVQPGFHKRLGIPKAPSAE